MPEDEYEPEDFVEGVDEEEDDEEGDDEPTAVFIAMTPGKDGADEAYRVIAGVCDRLGLEAVRLSGKQGGGGGSEALFEAVETSDFAIIDVSGKRPGLAEEIEVTDHEMDPAFVLLIARTGSPRLPEIEREGPGGGARTINFYADKGDLRALIERHLNAMIDAWHEGGEGGGGGGDDEDDEEE